MTNRTFLADSSMENSQFAFRGRFGWDAFILSCLILGRFVVKVVFRFAAVVGGYPDSTGVEWRTPLTSPVSCKEALSFPTNSKPSIVVAQFPLEDVSLIKGPSSMASAAR